MRRRAPYALLPLACLLLSTAAAAQDRIYVDQHSALRSELMIADADGSNPRKLVPGNQLDYNASFSSDGEWVLFTSERTGSADIFRVRADGTQLEQLTDSPAFDDQAALSPNGHSVAFVSSRGDGSADIYVMDLRSRELRNLTNAPGGDFRPSWSPDGRMLAFTSDRGTGFPRHGGRWEHSHATSVYLVRADGAGLRQFTLEPDMAAGSPKWSADGTSVVFYELPVEDTFLARAAGNRPSRIVSIDIGSGERTVHADGEGLKVSPQFVGEGIAYLARAGRSAALTFTDAEQGAMQDIANPAWSQDGSKVVYHSGQLATLHHYSRPPGDDLAESDARFDLVYGSGFPAVSPDGKQLIVSERLPSGDRSALVSWDHEGKNPRRIYQDPVTVMGLEWSPDGEWLAFGSGSFFTQRATRPATIMMIRPDGSDARAVTTGAGNAGFPSWSPDGRQIVYRYWTDQAEGLRIVDVATGESRELTTDYDTLPGWSPQGDRIIFSRQAKDERFPYDEFDIYSIRPDGSDLQRLTDAEGNDAHSFWSPDGNYILWSSSRFGYKDESALLMTQPQPYAELFIMNADGSEQRPLTDNQYEDGTPAWQPPVRFGRE